MLSQQPFGHELALQAHAPAVRSHICPAAQAAHWAPFLPQAALVAVMHWPAALQQPEVQEPPPQEHDPALQVWPAAQATQSAPLVPQAAAVGGVTQLSLLSQQPSGHVVALHAPDEEPPPPPAPVILPAPPPFPVSPLLPPDAASPDSTGTGVMQDTGARNAVASASATSAFRNGGMRTAGDLRR